MPRRTNARRRTRRRKKQVSKVNTTYTGKINRGVVPLTYMSKHRYVEEITMNASISSYDVYKFRANGMYDPDSTGTGHQPYGFDTLASLYDHFTVVGSKITVKPIITSTSNLTPGYLTVLVSDSGGRAAAAFTSGGVPFVIESLGSKIPMLTGRADLNASSTSRMFSAKKFFGVKDIVGESQYRGSSSADPTEQAYYEITQMAAGGNDPASQVYLVQIDYIAVWTERKNLGKS